MRDTMDLCVSCKGCRRECPTGIDMAKMKIEFRHQYNKRNGLSRCDRLIAYLPRYAPYAARPRRAGDLRRGQGQLFFARGSGERLFGLSAARPLPKWSSRPYGAATAKGNGPEVLLLVDTFNRYFEPENAESAERVLTRAGYRVTTPQPTGRPLCCGRTFLAAGLVDEAKAEARRMLDALAPAIAAGTPIIGLEPSCLLTLRDEFPSMLPGAETADLAGHAQLFEEFVETERAVGRFNAISPVAPIEGAHGGLAGDGHCHQKAFDTAAAAANALKLIPDLAVETFDSTCCGMAGSFGYEAEHYETSLRIGELGVLPRICAPPGPWTPSSPPAATSCRHQIADAAQREARHIVRLLDEASTPR